MTDCPSTYHVHPGKVFSRVHNALGELTALFLDQSEAELYVQLRAVHTFEQIRLDRRTAEEAIYREDQRDREQVLSEAGSDRVVAERGFGE